MTHTIYTYRLGLLNKHWSGQTMNINTVLRVKKPHRVCVFVYELQCMRCMPAGLCMLHHYISAWPAVRSAWSLLFYITALPFSFLLSALLWLCPHTTPFCSSAHLHLCGTSLTTVPSEQFFLHTHKHCQVELAGLHITQTACLSTSQPLHCMFAWN